MTEVVNTSSKMTKTYSLSTASKVASMRTHLAYKWWIAVYVIIGALSLFARLVRINLSDGDTPIFDEKHYATQAYQMLFNPGHIENYPGYGLVVHPPLGKWLISLGESLFGYTPLGWRLLSVVAGVLIVLMIMRIIHILTGNIVAVTAAGLIANMEGTQLVMSKLAMLDVFMALFITGMALCLVKDLSVSQTQTPWHQRWWLLASGILAGCAMSIKVSGVFYPAAMGVALVISVAVLSRNVMTTLKALGMGLVFYLIVPLCVVTLSWLPWFSQENSVYRHIAQAGKIEHPIPGWLASILSDSMESFASYQIGVMKFHSSLKSGVGYDNFHPWESKPDQWIFGARPMLLLDNSGLDNPLWGDGVGAAKFYLVGNVAVWYLLIPVVLWGLWKIITTRHYGWMITISGIALGLVPWFINYDRQQYFFYVVSFSMFLIIGVVLMLHDITSLCVKKFYPVSPVKMSLIVYGVYTVIVAAVFVAYLPWLYSLNVPENYHHTLELWDNWKQLKGYN